MKLWILINKSIIQSCDPCEEVSVKSTNLTLLPSEYTLTVPLTAIANLPSYSSCISLLRWPPALPVSLSQWAGWITILAGRKYFRRESFNCPVRSSLPHHHQLGHVKMNKEHRMISKLGHHLPPLNISYLNTCPVIGSVHGHGSQWPGQADAGHWTSFYLVQQLRCWQWPELHVLSYRHKPAFVQGLI